MSAFGQMEPKFCDIESISELPIDMPYLLSDVDGTQTKPEEKLLLGILAEDLDMGRAEDREAIHNAHENFKKGGERKEDYDPHLLDLGKLCATWFHHSGKTQSEVMQVSENWFRNKGSDLVMPHARPMMMEAARFRFHRAFVTGAPWEAVYPFAKHLGAEYVFAMMAEVDAYGKYTGEMKDKNNTGRMISKRAICNEFRLKHATAIGAGDTRSDLPLLETAYIVNPLNPNDLRGRGLMFNPRDDVIAWLERNYDDELCDGQIQILTRKQMKKGIDETMRRIRDTYRAVLIDNHRRDLLDEIDLRRPYTYAEKEALKKKRAEEGAGWL